MQHEEGEKRVVLLLSVKPAVAWPLTVPSERLKLHSLKLTANPLKASLLRRPNPLKQPSAIPSTGEKPNEEQKETSLSAAEKLILEEQERKRRRTGHDERGAVPESSSRHTRTLSGVAQISPEMTLKYYSKSHVLYHAEDFDTFAKSPIRTAKTSRPL